MPYDVKKKATVGQVKSALTEVDGKFARKTDIPDVSGYQTAGQVSSAISAALDAVDDTATDQEFGEMLDEVFGGTPAG